MTEELWFIGQQITNGLVLGSVYTLLAMGFSLTFGVLGLVNASHGHLYMIGAFTTFQVISWWFGPQPGVMAYIAALIISVSLVSVVGRAIYLLGIKPIWGGRRGTHYYHARARVSSREHRRRPLARRLHHSNRPLLESKKVWRDLLTDQRV